MLIMTDIFYKQNISAQAMLSDEERLTVVNVVASTRVAEELDLPDIAIQLNCEYEPEQFPGVVYRVVDPKLAILMFRSGRAVCTGGKNQQNIETGIERMIGDLRAAESQHGMLPMWILRFRTWLRLILSSSLRTTLE